jgi:hypothetical protein
MTVPGGQAALIVGALVIAASGCANTSDLAAARGNGVRAVLAHPLFDGFFTCSEHFAGQFEALGDALGADCMAERLEEIDGRFFPRTYRGLGHENEDWYGWNQAVLAPCRGEVMRLHINPVTNRPGTAGRPPASSITVHCEDGTHFVYAHIQAPAVAVGDRVTAGQKLARVGNNGYGRVPHIHVGAWIGTTPLQIRWDQTKMTLPPEFRK